MKESNQFIPLPASYLRSLPAPTIKRRIALNLYEMLVLFGVLAFTFLVPHLIIGVLFEVTAPSAILMAHVYLVLAFYFMWYWTKTGQTLAMQTWRIQLVNVDGAIMKRSQALMRFAIGSLWLIPAALLLFINIKMNPTASMGGSVSIIFFSITLFLWPLSAILDRKNRQSIPDRWSGTRLVQLPNTIPHPVSSSKE
ncbi:RDD family protein [Polynucleobacter cosmopolitanus]|uniref:RDD family protein n=1 Tax=Polynucleobacter cosmopolitanus TaxID=351345 RepID=UPI001FE69A76|nr:RDD family protein [Polynucleobacter cosmopolitanus]